MIFCFSFDLQKQSTNENDWMIIHVNRELLSRIKESYLHVMTRRLFLGFKDVHTLSSFMTCHPIKTCDWMCPPVLSHPYHYLIFKIK